MSEFYLVDIEQREQWKSALTRGIEQQLRMDLLHIDPWAATYHVQSSEDPVIYYEVLLQIGGGGRLSGSCTCQAGAHAIPCKHVALAIDECSRWPFRLSDPVSLMS